jgi:hypothetical protein
VSAGSVWPAGTAGAPAAAQAEVAGPTATAEAMSPAANRSLADVDGMIPH